MWCTALNASLKGPWSGPCCFMVSSCCVHDFWIDEPKAEKTGDQTTLCVTVRGRPCGLSQSGNQCSPKSDPLVSNPFHLWWKPSNPKEEAKIWLCVLMEPRGLLGKPQRHNSFFFQDCREPTEAHYERRVPAIPAQLSAPFGQLTGAPERLAPQLARLKAAQVAKDERWSRGTGSLVLWVSLLSFLFGFWT